MNQFIKIARWIKSIIAPGNQDFKIVAFSVLIASIIWLLSALNESYTTQISCPVSFLYDQEGTIEVKSPPDYIQANVTGVGWNILKQNISINKEPLEITIDNPVETRFLAGYTIQPLLAQHLSSLNLNFVVTDSIIFDIQPLKEKNVFLEVDSAALDLDQFYQIVSPIRVSPDSAIMRGPVTMIDTLPDWVFIPIPIENINQDINRLFQINHFDRRLISVQPEEAQVTIDVSRFISFEKEFNIELVNFPMDSSVYISPAQINLDFKIREEFIDEFSDTDFIVIADCNNINRQDSTLNLEIIETPFYVDEVSMDSNTVRVIYEKKENP